MILRKNREFTINMGNYESVKIGASVELDSDNFLDDPDVPDDAALMKLADELLTHATQDDIDEASALTNTRDSFILSWNKGK